MSTEITIGKHPNEVRIILEDCGEYMNASGWWQANGAGIDSGGELERISH